ncbi:hypothetical protein [Vitiosangium sp. GDMCC 1.1324]|uniref:hypothetical protein n=1 Tax=Vitiosangium sp. (strain GDMCC 1.1324) TaxID=2138576 RepID=UPI000D3484F2|nr:hypothetical protein [Vitiosangium sp. GDMCC 1.1324]PTL79289.1 hypothetical protein DAT35_34360 [Vitiosangium sp. GDMCC 1.1324]
MPTPSCCRTLLARTPSAEVARCTCGHIHVSLGPVTIRMDEGTLHATWHTLGDALRALSEAPPSPPEPATATGGWKQ